MRNRFFTPSGAASVRKLHFRNTFFSRKMYPKTWKTQNVKPKLFPLYAHYGETKCAQKSRFQSNSQNSAQKSRPELKIDVSGMICQCASFAYNRVSQFYVFGLMSFFVDFGVFGWCRVSWFLCIRNILNMFKICLKHV